MHNNFTILWFIVLFALSPFSKSWAQTDTAKSLTFSGYAEVYYSYDFANPANHEKPNFVYQHKRHNELNLNFAYAKANYTKTNLRGNLALMLGNYAQYNLSAEPTWAQLIYEANIGIKLSKQNNIWLDAGVLPSHIGFESAISADCWVLTRSILAENSPYYETGVKISYANKKDNFSASFLFLNGWQHIKKPDAIQKPSLGFQFLYKPISALTLNYSNFIGTDKPDSLDALRVFHNFYAIYEPNASIGFIIGFDIGTDKYNANDYGVWYSPVFIARYKINEKCKIAGRLEYYSDPHQIIIPTNTVNGFQTFGSSINFDYYVSDNIIWRSEGKYYQSKDAIFPQDNNFSLTSSIAIKL